MTAFIGDVWEKFDAGQETFTREEMNRALTELAMSQMFIDQQKDEMEKVAADLARERDLVDILRRSLAKRLVTDEVG
jgi:hypothetical protein